MSQYNYFSALFPERTFVLDVLEAGIFIYLWSVTQCNRADKETG